MEIQWRSSIIYSYDHVWQTAKLDVLLLTAPPLHCLHGLLCVKADPHSQISDMVLFYINICMLTYAQLVK